MNNEVIERYKKYLTNAQVKELAAKAERYKLLNAQNRATAQNSIAMQRRQALRGLQNVGLAGREGKLVSGVQAAQNDALERSYDAYNKQLRKVDDARTEAQAVRMANANIAAQRKAAEEQQKLTDIERQQAAAAVGNVATNITAAAAVGNVASKIAGAVNEKQQYEHNGDRLAQFADLYKQAKQFVSNYKPMSPRDYIGRRKYAEAKDIINNYDAYVNGDRLARFAVEYKVDLDKVRADDPDLAKTISNNADYWYKLIDANEQNWNRAISENTHDAKAAYERRANAYSNLARLAAAAKAPNEQRKLYMMTDDEFNVAFDAAEHAYKMAAQNAKIARYDSSDNMDDVTSDAYAKESEAMQRFAIFERVKRDRANNSDISYLAYSMTIPDSAKVKDEEYDSTVSFVSQNQQNWRAVPWAQKSEWNGRNWKEAYNRKWDATDYAKEHDTKGSKYAALVNEWSFINGRTALLYSQNFQGAQFFGNIKELIGSVFGGDVNRDAAYKWFRNSCVMAFRGDWETSGTASQKEQMDAMLTLANLMTDEERARFNALLDNIGASAADKYFRMLYTDVLPERFASYVQGEEAFDTSDTYGKVMQSIASVPVNIAQSIPGVVHTLKTNQDDPVAARLSATKYTTAQNMRNAVSKDFGRFGQFAYGTGMSMADSATVALIGSGIGGMLEGVAGMSAEVAGKAGSTIGGALLGASAFNSSYKEAIERGLSPDEARATALGNGINEMLFEAVSLDMLVGHFQKGGILKVSKNGFVNWLVNTMVQGGVEGSEEVFTDIGNNVWDKLVNGVYAEEVTKLREYISQGMSYSDAKRKVNAEYAEQLGMSFLGGFVSGGVMGGGASFLGMLQGQDVAKIGRNLDDAAKAEIREYDFKNEEAKEILTGKLTDEDYGRLAMTRIEEMAQTDPFAADKAAQSLIDAMARTDVKVNKRNQTLKTGTDNSVSFDYDGVTDVKKMSGVQVEALRFAQTLVKSKVGGVNINVANQLFDKNGNEQNGWYDAKTNTVHVSLNGSQSVVYTISHELTHRLKSGNEEAYASMRDAMKDELESLDLTGSDLPGEYENILGDYLVKDGVQRTAWEALVDYEMDRYAKHGITLSREAAEEEVVCRACETMLEKSRLISSMVSRNVRSAKKIAKLLASISEDIEALKAEAESRGYEDGSPEQMFIDQYANIEKIANAWASAMKGVSEKEGKRKPKTERISKSKNGDYARLSKSETAKASGNIDVTADVVAEGENGKPLSIKSLDFDMRSGKMYKDLVEHGVMTEEEVVKFDRFLKDLVAYIKPNRAFLDMNESYTKDNRPFTAFKDNSDPLYKLSLDFSTLCRKRLTTQYIIEKLQLKLKKALSAEEQLAVRDMLKQYQKIDKGLQVACGMCYVEAARYKSPKQINMWLESDGRRKAMTQYFAVTDKQFTETVKQKQAEWKVQHGYADNATKDAMSASDRNAFNRMSYDLRQSYEMDAEHQAILDKALSLPKEQFLSAANLAELAEGDDAERTIYNAYTRFIRAATRSKSLEADIPYYYGDSESRVSDTFVKNVNAENGMRFDSWSDFQFTHLLDMITAIADLSVRGSAMHGYTKFPEFVRMFGKTGAMFNLSGVPQGIGLKQDGSLDFSPTESINEEEAIKLREEFPETAGFQSIGINDRHINALLDSDFIDYVIPYHVSGMNAKLRSIAKIAGWSNYQDVQNAKIDHSLDGNKAKCDPAVWHVEPVFSEFFVGYNTGMSGIDAMRASAQRYVDMCHERGLKPKFEKFLNNENYWKLLIDRKMINQKTGALIEQKAVKPNFDLDTIKREIDKYVNSYDQNREENAFNYIVDRWDEVPALVAKLEKEGKAEKKRQQEAAKNIDMLKGEMVNAVPGRIPAKAAAQKFSIKESDSQYMDLARRYESGDKSVEAELRKQVDAAAKAAGFPVRAYHGTDMFGYTVIDTENFGDDNISYWAADNKKAAATYTKYGIVRSINGKIAEEDIERMIQETDSDLNDAISDFRHKIDRTFSEWYFGRDDDSIIRNAVDRANPEIGSYGNSVYDVLEEMMADAFYSYKDSMDGYDDFADFSESDEAQELYDAISAIEGYVAKLDVLNKLNLTKSGEIEDANGGVYDIYTNTDNFFELDAHGKAWNELRDERLPNINRNGYNNVPYRTRDVVKWAKENGYDGVVFKNIKDNGRYGRTEPFTVYAFLKPHSQVKSADLITKDDNGNIIPLSERFKTDRMEDAWKNEDIRYSVKDSVKRKAEFVGKVRDRNGYAVHMLYRYRGHEYMITDEHNGYSEPIWVKHKNEQDRIDREIADDERRGKEPREQTYEGSAQEGFDMFWDYVENGEDRFSINDKDFVLKKNNGEKWYELRDAKAKLYGSSVEMEGGTLLNKVRMMQNLAEMYGSVTTHATSEKEAEAFKRAGAQRVSDPFVQESENDPGTWEFTHTENKYEQDTRYDAKQKRNFANAVLKEVGTYRNFKKEDLRVMRAKLEKAFAVLHNAWHGDGDQFVAMEYADKLFDQILNRYTEMSEADADVRDALLAEMPVKRDARGREYREIEVTAAQMAEIKNTYTVAEFNAALSKALGTRVAVKQTENAQTLEDVFKDNPYLNASTNEGDMPMELLKKAEETVGKRTNPYKAESEERAALKDAMMSTALTIVGIEKSSAQKVREAVKQVRAEERAKAKTKTQTEVEKARLAERMHEGAIRAKERRASAERETNIKREAARREAKLKDVTQRKLAEQKVELLRRDVKSVALKWNQRLVKMLANPTEASHIPVQLAREVAEFTDALTRYLDSGTQRGQINLEKIGKAYQQAFDDQATITQAKAENPKYDPRGTVLDREMYDEQLVQMINELNTILQGKSLKDLNPFEMRMLLNTVRGVAHTVYEANRMIGTTERKAIWQVGDQMVQELESAPKIKGGFARFFLEESLDLRRIAKVFSGSNENAEFVKLSDALNRGAIEKERVAQVLSGMFDPLTQQYGDEIRKWYGKNAEWIDTGITKNGRKVEITKGMRVSLAMHVLNTGNMRHIENGGVTIPNRELYAKGKLADAYANGTLVRLNADQINTIISQMTEAEKAYVGVAKEFFHQRTGYYVNKTSLQLLGYRKATVENYFPIHTDRNYTKTDFASVVRDGSIEGQGFLKERVMASNPVYLEDITSVVNRQIKGVSLYAGLAVPMRNFNAVMNASVYEDENGNWVPRTTVRKAMTQSMGEYGAKVVQGFLQDVSGMSAVDVTPGERIVAKLQTRYVKAVLLANLKVTLKQAASYPTAAAVIPWKYLGKALLKGGRNHRLISRADVDLINQYTPLYKMRRDGMANEITSIMAERGLEQKMPWLLGWITKMDVATVGRLWSAAEYMVADQQNLPVGSDEYYKAVAEVFNQTIQQTQPNFTPLQRNAALRSKNPVIRTLTLFGTQRMQNGGILIESAMELAHSKNMSKEAQAAAKAKFGRAVVSQLVQNVMLVAIGFVVDALRGRMTAWQDDDKDVTLESVAQVMGDQFLGNIFGSFLGGSEAWDIISTAFKRATNASAYDTEFTVPSLDAIETIIGFFNKDSVSFVQYMSGNHTAEEKIARLKSFSFKVAKAAGYLTGFPFENIAKTIVKGWIPALQDIKDYADTGELIPWLHQSGKLDSANTAANYKEWTNNGFKGSEYFYWENVLTAYGKREEKIPILLDADLPNEMKAMLLRMMDKSGATSEGTVVYKSNGDVLIDFANPTEKQQALPMPTAETEETATPTTTPTATPKPTENPLTDARQEGVKEAVAKGVPEQTAFDAFLAYQNMGKNKSDDYSRNDDFRAWLFANVDSPEQRAVLEYQVIGTAKKVEGSVTYRDSGVVFRDYTNESWFKLSEHNLSKDGTNKRYEAGKRLEKTGLSVDKTVAIYDALAEYTKKAEWTEYLKKQGLTDEQVNIFLWSRGWAKLG